MLAGERIAAATAAILTDELCPLLPYSLFEPVCRTAEYWPGRLDAAVVLDITEALLPRLCNVLGAVDGLVPVKSVLLRLKKRKVSAIARWDRRVGLTERRPVQMPRQPNISVHGFLRVTNGWACLQRRFVAH